MVFQEYLRKYTWVEEGYKTRKERFSGESGRVKYGRLKRSSGPPRPRDTPDLEQSRAVSNETCTTYIAAVVSFPSSTLTSAVNWPKIDQYGLGLCRDNIVNIIWFITNSLNLFQSIVMFIFKVLLNYIV